MTDQECALFERLFRELSLAVDEVRKNTARNERTLARIEAKIDNMRVQNHDKG